MGAFAGRRSPELNDVSIGAHVGRTGSVLGSLLAEIMRSRWSTEQLCLAAAVPALISAVAIASLRPAMRRSRNAALHNAGDAAPIPET